MHRSNAFAAAMGAYSFRGIEGNFPGWVTMTDGQRHLESPTL